MVVTTGQRIATVLYNGGWLAWNEVDVPRVAEIIDAVLNEDQTVDPGTLNRTADEHLEAMIGTCRALPHASRVTYRINGGEWQHATGRGFLDLWDQPIAGSIDIDAVVVLDG